MQLPTEILALTSMDFFQWGYVKGMICNILPITEGDMKMQIKYAFSSITSDMLRNVRRAFEERVISCIEENGNYIEC